MYRLNVASGDCTTWPMPDLIGCFALTGDGAAIVGLKSGFSIFDFASSALTPVAEPEPHLLKNRINDGKCDPAGRFWAGTMQDGGGPATGTLYRIDVDGACEAMERDFIVPNGLAWSPKGDVFYIADSPRRIIRQYPFDVDAGVLGPSRIFASTEGHPGLPDGATMDVDGCLWSAEFRGSRIVRYTPDGVIDTVVELPLTQVTSCVFGGPDLDVLYITTARQRLTPEELASQPLAGSVLACRPGTAGLLDQTFAGLQETRNRALRREKQDGSEKTTI
jgi:sugar lactone lactonase YvrE